MPGDAIADDPHVEFAALAVLWELLVGVAGEHGWSLSSNTPVSGAAGEARDQTGECSCEATINVPITDKCALDLFGLPAPVGFDQRVPAWRVLPDETRRAVTELMTRLLLDHGRVDRRSTRTEAVDDV